MANYRVTLDTNVLVAGTRSRNGASFQVLSAWLEGRYRVCASVPLWIEYEATLTRSDVAAGHGLSQEQIHVLLDAWAKNVIPVELHYTWRPQVRDPKDEMVFDTALNGHADALVTFNQTDFIAAAKRFELPLWHPRDLLQRLRA
jgi:putative PIN family toxin of toxin-antitoxin system